MAAYEVGFDKLIGTLESGEHKDPTVVVASLQILAMHLQAALVYATLATVLDPIDENWMQK